ncbi:MAG: DUF4157 domain-containing protein [Candidatus Tectimicrobiota bacterium]
MPTLLSLGSRACVVNAELTQNRNRRLPAQPLDATVVAYLRPWFGSLVEPVRVVWQARLNDRFVLGGEVLARGSRAQTYGYHIYVAASQGAADPGSSLQLLLLAHELVHTEQFVQAGGRVSRFCQAYIQGWEQRGGIYTANPLEQEAFERTFALAQWLAEQFPEAARRDPVLYTHEGEGPQGRTVMLPRRLPTPATAVVRPQATPRPRP